MRESETLVYILLFCSVCWLFLYSIVENDNNHKSKAQATEERIRYLEEAMDAFYLDIGRYPNSNEGLDVLIECSCGMSWDGPYITGGISVLKDPWGNKYNYRYPSQHKNRVDIFSYGKDMFSKTNGDDKDDINNWDKTGRWRAAYSTTEKKEPQKNIAVMFIGLLLIITVIFSSLLLIAKFFVFTFKYLWQQLFQSTKKRR